MSQDKKESLVGLIGLIVSGIHVTPIHTIQKLENKFDSLSVSLFSQSTEAFWDLFGFSYCWCPRFHMVADEVLAPRHPIRLQLLLQLAPLPHIMSPLYDYPI